ncbi:T9SS type A sorting domain-containing protein [Peijinzhouia sedimentorum]
MRKIFVILFFTLILYLPTFGQFWGENFNTKQYNDFTETGWRFNEDGTFNISTNNDFSMTSRHIRSQLIYNNSLVVTYTGYLYYIGGTTYTTSFDHSCVCYDVNDNNALPRIEVAYESFTTGNIVSTSGSYITNKNILNNATSTFTPTTSGWYRIRLTLSRNINNGQAMVAIDNFTSNVPTTENWFDTTVPMDQSFNISASETIVENGDNVKFTVDYTLNNAQWYTRVKGAQFQIDLPAGFTYQSHTITGWNYDNSQTNYNSNTGIFTIWTNNVVPVIKLEINTVVNNAQPDVFASVYSSNFQPQNPSSSTVSPTPIVIIPNATQPIELISFDAKANGTVNEINWATATEKNNDYFSIERSADGINFNEIAKVTGAGDFTGRLDYKYTDLRPLNGTSYYRIRQTDYDGTFSIFQAIRVQRNDVEATAFKIVGNPSNGNRVIMQMNIEENAQTSTVKIFDNSGSMVAQKEINSRDLYNNEYILDGLKLSKGLHIVSFETAGKKYSERLMVK